MREASWLRTLLTFVTVAVLMAISGPALSKTDPHWGLLAEVVERDFHTSGMVGKEMLLAFRWVEPGRKMVMLHAYREQRWRRTITLDANSGKLIDFVEGGKPQRETSLIVKQDGAVYFEKAKSPMLMRQRDSNYYFVNTTLIPTAPNSPASLIAAQLIAAGELRAANPNLQAVAVGRPAHLAQPATSSDGSVEAAYKRECASNPTTQLCTTLAKSLPAQISVQADTKLSSTMPLASPSVAPSMPDAYTFFQSLSGQWSNGETFYDFTLGASGIRLDSRNDRGSYADPLFIKKKGDVVKFYGKRVVPFDGGYMIGDWVAYIPLSQNELKIRRGKVVGGAFVEMPSDWPITRGTYRRLNAAQAQAFIASSEVIRAQRIRDDNSSSGLAGALAMGLGTALAGGNPEQVMGMAMKGAELTTDNEMSRNVLAGQGDAMVAEGTQRMREENASKGGAASPNSESSALSVAGSTSASPAGAQPEERLSRRTISAYFWVGMQPTEKDTRNPVCISEPIQISIDWNERGWGNNERVDAVLAPKIPVFTAECGRHGAVVGTPTYLVEKPWEGAKSGDTVVRVQ